MGEAMKQMADVKYSLDDNIKQNFLEPLHHLQTKDLKEVMVNFTLIGKVVRHGGHSIREHCPSLTCDTRFCSSTTGKNFRDEGSTSTASEDVKRKVHSAAMYSLYLPVSLLIYLSSTRRDCRAAALRHENLTRLQL